MSFLIGIGGSLHCLGMCGPIALAMPLHGQILSKALINRLIYHLGRIMIYGVLGLVIGIFGFGIALAGIQQYVSIAIGIWLIVYIIFSNILSIYTSRIKFIGRYVTKIKNLLGRYLKEEGHGKRFVLGMLNGLLPCGLIYIALANAMLARTPIEGMVFMMIFGIGTIPSLLIFPFIGRYINIRKMRLGRIIPYLVISLGVFLIVRGASFDYPLMNKASEIITNCLPQ